MLSLGLLYRELGKNIIRVSNKCDKHKEVLGAL
ncbi:MAG: hypothetical protein RLZ12_589 [Bacillota bacterium]